MLICTRKEANFGYAFINFTTTAAAKKLYCSLQNCVWKVHGSKKVIRIDQATQQVGVSCVCTPYAKKRNHERDLMCLHACDGAVIGCVTD